MSQHFEKKNVILRKDTSVLDLDPVSGDYGWSQTLLTTDHPGTLCGLRWEMKLCTKITPDINPDIFNQQVIWMIYKEDRDSASATFPNTSNGAQILLPPENVIVSGILCVDRGPTQNVSLNFEFDLASLQFDVPTFSFGGPITAPAGTGTIGPIVVPNIIVQQIGGAVLQTAAGTAIVLPGYGGHTIDKSKGETRIQRKMNTGDRLIFTSIVKQNDPVNGDSGNELWGNIQFFIKY